MNNIIGYIDCKEDFSIFQKYFNKMYFKVNTQQIDKNSFKILINRKDLNERRLNRLEKVLKKQKINTLAISLQLSEAEKDLKRRGFKILNGKIVMKVLLKEILSYICEAMQSDMPLEDLYIAVESDKYYNLIVDLAENFKSINIVTNCIRKLRRLEKKLDNNSSIVYSISGNRKKSLKRAKIILNFDYDDEFFKNFSYNREAVVINLNEKLLNLKRGYQGTVIENISVSQTNKETHNHELKNFNNVILCESKILNKDYYEARDILTRQGYVIENLIGKNGIIDIIELKPINLDKNDKMD